ncbi:flagellar biosynthetic protein FliQ [Bradyrhizobium japonicum]
MNVNSATDSTSKSNATSSTQNTATNTVDYNTFLQLLVAEMKNQDPTNPMDTSQYMSQFAQLSTVEQAMQTNSKLDALLSSQSLSQANGLIGKTVSFTDATGANFSGKVVSISINSDGSIATLENGTKVAVGPRPYDQPVMNERDALDIVQAAIWTIIVASGPAVGAAMLVGTAIALIQALTQVQEVTLTFVPKIIVILVVVAVSGSFIGAHLSTFTEMVYSRIEHGF